MVARGEQRGHQKKKRVSEGTERGGRRREDKLSETERSEMNAGCMEGGGGVMAQLIVTNNRDTQRPHSLTSARTLTLCGLVMRTVAWMSRVQTNRDKGENSLSS